MNLKAITGKRAYLIIGGCVLLVLIIIGWNFRAGQIQEQERLQKELEVVTTRLAGLEIDQLAAQQQRLQEQIDASTGELGQAQFRVASTTDSIAAGNTLYGMAIKCGVEITDIGAGSSYAQKVENVPCTVVPVRVTAEGQWQNLLAFTELLKTDFNVSRVESANLNIPLGEGEALPAVDITLMVFTYGGS